MRRPCRVLCASPTLLVKMDAPSACFRRRERRRRLSTPDTATTRGNQHLLFRGVGNTVDTNQSIWLRITNETVYRAFNPRHNGVKRQSLWVRK